MNKSQKNKKHWSLVIGQPSMVNGKMLRRGFTLVELLIVSAIIIIMSGVLLGMNASSGAGNDVDTAAQQIAAQLRELQNESLTGKMVNDGTSHYIPACQFILDSSAGTSYNIGYKDCVSSSLIGTWQTVNIKQMHVTVSPKTIIFNSPGTGVVTASSIVVTSTKTISLTKTVSINSSGNISITSP